jgi:hypothetical protein
MSGKVSNFRRRATSFSETNEHLSHLREKSRRRNLQWRPGFVVFELMVSSVVGSLLLAEASGTATAYTSPPRCQVVLGPCVLVR